MTRQITILLVDDHLLVREGLRTMLSSEADFQVVGEAGTVEEAVRLVQELQPHVVLMDIRLPDGTGTEATRQVKRLSPTTAVLMLTMYDSQMYVVEAVAAGAGGYLTKDVSRELLCHAVRSVVSGGALVSSKLLRQALAGFRDVSTDADAPGASTLLEALTGREREVLRLLAHGRDNRAMCGELGLADVTVRKHVQNVIGKLGVSDRTQAALAGMRLGLAE